MNITSEYEQITKTSPERKNHHEMKFTQKEKSRLRTNKMRQIKRERGRNQID